MSSSFSNISKIYLFMERKLLKRYMDAKDGQLTPQPIYGDTQLLREASCGDYFPQQAVGLPRISGLNTNTHVTKIIWQNRLPSIKRKCGIPSRLYGRRSQYRLYGNRTKHFTGKFFPLPRQQLVCINDAHL